MGRPGKRMPTSAPPPTAEQPGASQAASEPEGDIRRGGWVLVLVGVVLVLVALALLLLL